MLVAGNWKMFKTARETSEFCAELRAHLGETAGIEVAVCPPYTSLASSVEALVGSGIEVFAQNAHWEREGAFTGEVSPPMLVDLEVDGVVLGHSERREHFCESDDALRLKVPAALDANLLPILCVGETEEERESEETESKLRHQVETDLADVPDDRLADVAIAYEPIWAIGSGKTATPEQAQEAIAFIRERIRERSSEQAERIRILYGGSLKPDNADELLGLPDIDGSLVGGASLDIDDFTALVDAAGR